MPAERQAGAAALMRALAWRTRREGLVFLLFAFVPFLAIAGGITALAALDDSTVNGQRTFAAVGARYGASTDAVAVGLVLVTVPGIVAVFTGTSVGLVVRNLIGSEASRGGLESLLAGPYRPRSITLALLGYVGVVATALWAGMTAIGAGLLALVVSTSDADLSLSASYVLLVLVLPLLAAWASTALAVLVSLLAPRLTQPGQFGVAMNGGGLPGLASVLPGVAVLLVLAFGAEPVSPGVLLAIAGGITAVIALSSAAIASRWFRPENVLES